MLSDFQKIMLRLSLLFILMLGLLFIFNSKQDEKARKIEVEEQSKKDSLIHQLGYDDPQRRAAKPLDIPDFGNGPIFLLTGDYLEFSKGIYDEAKQAREKIRALKLERAGKTLNEPINLSLIKTASTSREFNERYLQFRLQELEAYRELTTDKEAIKLAGEKFLHAYLLNATRQNDAPSDAEVLQLAKKVIALESKDPLLRTYIAYILYRATGDLVAAETMWIDCIEKLRKSQYPEIVQVYLRLLVVDCRTSAGDGQKQALIVSILRWLEAESENEQWNDCVHHKLAGIWDQSRLGIRDRLLVCCLRSNKIDPFIKHWLTGVRIIEKAWDSRRGRFPKDMGPGGYQSFNINLRRGATHLEYAYSLRPDSVFPAYKMMSVALAGVDRDYQTVDWFRRTLENRIDYYPAYESLLNSMLPRWGGSLDDCYDFAEQCIESNRFDTHIPYYVFETMQNLRSWEFKKDWEELKEFGANDLIDDFLDKREDYRAAHPEEKLYGDTAYYRARIGLILEKIDRPQDAIAEYKAAQGNLDFSQLQYQHRPGKFLLRRLFASQGEVQSRVMQFDEKLRQTWPANTDMSEIDQLEKEWQELKLTAKDDLARQYYAHTEVMLKQLKAYFQGDWVDLSFRDQGLGWEISSQKIDWESQEQDLLVCRETTRTQAAWARPLINLEAPFQIQANVEQNVSYPGKTHINLRWTGFNENNDEKPETKADLFAAIHGNWSYPQSKDPTEFRSAEDLKCSFNVNYLASRTTLSNSQYLRVMDRGMHLIDWKIREKSSEVTLGNYLDIIRFDNVIPQQAYLIFSSQAKSKSFRAPCNSGFIWKLKNVRMRRLPVESLPSEDAPFEQRIVYWEDRMKKDPDDVVARFKLCEVYWNHGLAQKQLDLVNETLEKWPNMEKIQQFRGLALYKLGRYREAFASLELAMKEYRDDIDVIMVIAEIKSAILDEDLQNQKDSLQLAEFGKRCSTNYRLEFKARHWAALAVAYANNNKFEEALQANQQAMTQADDNFKDKLLERQKLYQASKPYRFPTSQDL